MMSKIYVGRATAKRFSSTYNYTTELKPSCLSQNICFNFNLQLQTVIMEFMRHYPTNQFSIINKKRHFYRPFVNKRGYAY